MMEALRVTSRLVIPAEELRASFARSGGPGGQNVNKVESKVVLRFDVRGSRSLGEARRARVLEHLASRLTGTGELVIHASRHRQRAENLADARERLAEHLREALRERAARHPTRPTRSSRERRLGAKKRRSTLKRDRKGGGE
jgi:ribosome-associated protein